MTDKKELKEEDIEKVNGGNGSSSISCAICQKEYRINELKLNSNYIWLCCPKCGTKLVPMVG